MKKDAFFTNRYVFMATTIIASICFLLDAIIVLRFNPSIGIFNATVTVLLALCLIFILHFSRAHKENTVKSLIGIVLGIAFAYDLRFFDKNYSWFTGFQMCVGITKLVVGILLILTYLKARQSSTDKYNYIRMCKILFFVSAIMVILNNMPYFISDFPEENHFWFIQDVAETIAFIGVYLCITCVTCTVYKYKSLRTDYASKGEWTEELRAKTKTELFG